MTLSEMLLSNAEQAAHVGNPNIMDAEEVAEARRFWKDEQENCIVSEDLAIEAEGIPVSEGIWIAYCQWCAFEFGTSILG